MLCAVVLHTATPIFFPGPSPVLLAPPPLEQRPPEKNACLVALMRAAALCNHKREASVCLIDSSGSQLAPATVPANDSPNASPYTAEAHVNTNGSEGAQVRIE